MTTSNRIRANIENVRTLKRNDTPLSVANNITLALIHLERAAQEHERLKKS